MLLLLLLFSVQKTQSVIRYVGNHSLITTSFLTAYFPMLNAASMYRLHNISEHGSGVTNMYSLSNAASRAATPLQVGEQLVLISGTNGQVDHHYHHHHHHGGQLFLEDRIHPNNGDLIGLSHSHTLPHNLSHHIKGNAHFLTHIH